MSKTHGSKNVMGLTCVTDKMWYNKCIWILGEVLEERRIST